MHIAQMIFAGLLFSPVLFGCSKGELKFSESRDYIADHCSPITRWLIEQKEVYKRCPAELTPEYDELLRSLPWKAEYFIVSDTSNTVCGITVGDYAENGGTYYWNSKRNAWYADF